MFIGKIELIQMSFLSLCLCISSALIYEEYLIYLENLFFVRIHGISIFLNLIYLRNPCPFPKFD